MRGDDVRVLVVGAGIAGLAAARTLRDWGAALKVVDRHPDHPRKAPGSTCRETQSAPCPRWESDIGSPNAPSTSSASGQPTATDACS